MDAPHDNDRDRNGESKESDLTFEGRHFPSEAEWLDLPPPPFAGDFVARTLAALRQDHGAGGPDDAAVAQTDTTAGPTAGPTASPRDEIAGHLLSADQLAAFEAPEPSVDFVARTLRAIQDDRRARWQELLAKYVSPEPSPEFVARTLRALAADRPQGIGPQGKGPQGKGPFAEDRLGLDGRHGSARQARHLTRRWWLPLLATVATIAASVAVLVHWAEPAAPFEERLADAVRPSFAHGYAASPLPALLGNLDSEASPEALPTGGADGMWILLHRKPR